MFKAVATTCLLILTEKAPVSFIVFIVITGAGMNTLGEQEENIMS
jgi:hypothetical protein